MFAQLMRFEHATKGQLQCVCVPAAVVPTLNCNMGRVPCVASVATALFAKETQLPPSLPPATLLQPLSHEHAGT